MESSRELGFELDRDEAVVIDWEGARAEAAEILRTHSIPAAASIARHRGGYPGQQQQCGRKTQRGGRTRLSGGP